MRPLIHPLQPLDFAELLAIERACYPHPWGKRDFVETLSPTCTCRVAKQPGQESPLGFVLYSRRQSRLVLIKLAVDPLYRRRSIATELVIFLKTQLNFTKPRIDAYLAESNLAGQLFLKRMGFRAISVLTAADPYTGEDLYLMRHARTASATAFTVDRCQPTQAMRSLFRPARKLADRKTAH